jgi:hypothetical protein
MLEQAYQFYDLDRHPIVAAFDQEVKEPRRKGEKVLRSSPSKFADYIHHRCSHTRILTLVHQNIFNLRPSWSKRFWVDQRQSVQSNDGLLPNVGVGVRQPWH